MNSYLFSTISVSSCTHFANGDSHSQLVRLHVEARDYAVARAAEELQVLVPGALVQPLRVVRVSKSRRLFPTMRHTPSSSRFRLSRMRPSSLYHLYWNRVVRMYLLRETVVYTSAEWALLCWYTGQSRYARTRLELQQKSFSQKRHKEELDQDRRLHLILISHQIIRTALTKAEITGGGGSLLPTLTILRAWQHRDYMPHPHSTDLVGVYTPIVRGGPPERPPSPLNIDTRSIQFTSPLPNARSKKWISVRLAS